MQTGSEDAQTPAETAAARKGQAPGPALSWEWVRDPFRDGDRHRGQRDSVAFKGDFAPNACWLPQKCPSRMSCTIAPLQQQRVCVDLAVALGSRRLPAGTYAVSNIRQGRDVAGSFTFSVLGPTG